MSDEEHLGELSALRQRVAELERALADRDRANVAAGPQPSLPTEYLDIAAVMIVVLNRDETVAYINQAGADILEHELPGIIGKNWFDHFVPQDERKRVRREFQRLVNGENEADRFLENRVLTKRGKERAIAWTNTVLRDAVGQIVQTLSSGTDISERLRTEQALRESDERNRRQLAELDNLYDTAPVGLCLLDADLRFVRINARLAAYNGATPAEHIGRTVRDVVPDIAVEVEPIYRQVIRTGQPFFDQHVRGSTPAYRGQERHWLVSYVPLKHANGTVYGINTVVADVTEEKETGETLRRYERIVSSTQDHMSFVDADYVYRAVNDAYLADCLLSREQIIGKPVREVLGEDVFDRLVRRQLDRCLAGEHVSYQAWFDFPGRGRCFMDVGYSPYRDAGGSIAGVAVCARDLTQRKKAEEALRESEERFRALAENLPGAVYCYDVRPDVTRVPIYVGPGFEKLIGDEPAERIRKGNINAYFDLIHPEDRQRMEAAGLFKPESAGPVDVEYRLRSGSGDYIWVRAIGRATPQADASLRWHGVLIDVTDRRTAEEAREQLEARLRQSQKLQAVGQLAAGVAHDFNSILSVILGNTEFMQRTLQKRRALKPTGPVADSLDHVYRAVERGRTMVQKLLTFGRTQVWKPQPLDLNVVISDMHRLLDGLIGKKIKTRWSQGTDLQSFRADAGQVEQVIMNLLLNARDAMPAGGTLTIETANVNLTEADRAGHPEARCGPHVMLMVRDTGVGMTGEALERAFEPFFSTKPVDKGSGLGLSIVYAVVRQAGGHITVSSTPGEGTCFKVYFPAMH